MSKVDELHPKALELIGQLRAAALADLEELFQQVKYNEEKLPDFLAARDRYAPLFGWEPTPVEPQAIKMLRNLLISVESDQPERWERVGLTDLLVFGPDIAAGLRLLAAHPAPAWQPGPPRELGWYWVSLTDTGPVMCEYIASPHLWRYINPLAMHIGPLAAPEPPQGVAHD